MEVPRVIEVGAKVVAVGLLVIGALFLFQALTCERDGIVHLCGALYAVGGVAIGLAAVPLFVAYVASLGDGWRPFLARWVRPVGLPALVLGGVVGVVVSGGLFWPGVGSLLLAGVIGFFGVGQDT